MNIFVGNLSQEVTETDLAELFKQFGQVKSTEVKRDLFSGVTKGIGFVKCPEKITRWRQLPASTARISRVSRCA